MRIMIWRLPALVAALVLGACTAEVQAPTNPGVCWRLTMGADGKADFTPVSNSDQNLETCAAHLEAVAMRENKTVLTGAYRGQFVFITPVMVQSALRLNGVRYRLFDADTRAKVDRDLRWMLEDEKHASAFGPRETGTAAPK
jgi:hypothetical protein